MVSTPWIASVAERVKLRHIVHELQRDTHINDKVSASAPYTRKAYSYTDLFYFCHI